MNKVTKLALLATVIAASPALAQQSEFLQKLQEDMDYYQKQIVENCKAPDKLAMKWTGGKLKGNPRETLEGQYSAVSTLCTSALEGLNSSCQDNKVVASKISKVSTINCTVGKGTIGYKLKGGDLTFSIDTAYDKNNPAGQRDDLVKKLKAELDD